jgi:hypothetical protein
VSRRWKVCPFWVVACAIIAGCPATHGGDGDDGDTVDAVDAGVGAPGMDGGEGEGSADASLEGSRDASLLQRAAVGVPGRDLLASVQSVQ